MRRQRFARARGPACVALGVGLAALTAGAVITSLLQPGDAGAVAGTQRRSARRPLTVASPSPARRISANVSRRSGRTEARVALQSPASPASSRTDVSATERSPSVAEVGGEVRLPAARLFDKSLSLAERRQAAFSLARLGSAEALSLLEEAFLTSPPYLKEGIAHSLGRCRHPRARVLLAGILEDELDEAVLRGAVRGLAALNDEDGIRDLGAILTSTTRPASVRDEAARQLGGLPSRTALVALVEAYSAIDPQDRELRRAILGGLGRRDFGETGTFFESLLAEEDVTNELRVDLLEALEGAGSAASSLLVDHLGDPIADVRAAAAWSLASLKSTAELATALSATLQVEHSPFVRTRLFQALEKQATVDLESVVPLAFKEEDPEARIAAANFLAAQIRAGSDTTTARYAPAFDAKLVPHLKAVILEHEDYGLRTGAAIALKKAATDTALAALESVAASTSDARILEVLEREDVSAGSEIER